MAVENVYARSYKDVVAKPRATRNVDVRHNPNSGSHSDDSFQCRLIADRAVVACANFGTNHRVMSGLEIVAKHNIAVDDRSSAKNPPFPDSRPATVGMVAKADEHVGFDDGPVTDRSVVMS